MLKKVLIGLIVLVLTVGKSPSVAAEEYVPRPAIDYNYLIAKLAPELLTDEWLLKATEDRIVHDQDLLKGLRKSQAELKKAATSERADYWKGQITKYRNKMFFQPKQVEGRAAAFAARELWPNFKVAILEIAERAPTKFASQYRITGLQYDFETGRLYTDRWGKGKDFLMNPRDFPASQKAQGHLFPSADNPYFVYALPFNVHPQSGDWRSKYIYGPEEAFSKTVPAKMYQTHPFPPEWNPMGVGLKRKLALPALPMGAANAEKLVAGKTFSREELHKMRQNGTYYSRDLIFRIEGEFTGIVPIVGRKRGIFTADIHRLQLISFDGEVLNNYPLSAFTTVQAALTEQQMDKAGQEQAEVNEKAAAAKAKADAKNAKKDAFKRKLASGIENCPKRKLEFHRTKCRAEYICRYPDMFPDENCDDAKAEAKRTYDECQAATKARQKCE